MTFQAVRIVLLCFLATSLSAQSARISVAQMQRIYDEVTGIQLGKKEDPFNWTVKVEQVEV